MKNLRGLKDFVDTRCPPYKALLLLALLELQFFRHPSIFGGNATTFAPHKVRILIARRQVAFGEKLVVHRVIPLV